MSRVYYISGRWYRPDTVERFFPSKKVVGGLGSGFSAISARPSTPLPCWAMVFVCSSATMRLSGGSEPVAEVLSRGTTNLNASRVSLFSITQSTVIGLWRLLSVWRNTRCFYDVSFILKWLRPWYCLL